MRAFQFGVCHSTVTQGKAGKASFNSWHEKVQKGQHKIESVVLCFPFGYCLFRAYSRRRVAVACLVLALCTSRAKKFVSICTGFFFLRDHNHALRNCSKSIADSLVMSESAADEKYSILKLIYVQIKTFPKQESALIIAKSSSSMCISVAWKLCQHFFKDNAQN